MLSNIFSLTLQGIIQKKRRVFFNSCVSINEGTKILAL